MLIDVMSARQCSWGPRGCWRPPPSRRFAAVCLDRPGIAERAVGAGGADGDRVGVEHHEGEAAVAFGRMPGRIETPQRGGYRYEPVAQADADVRGRGS